MTHWRTGDFRQCVLCRQYGLRNAGCAGKMAAYAPERVTTMALILVVEDDKINAKLFDVVFRRLGGYDVIVTEDATEAIDVARSGAVDLIMMDVSLTNTQYQGEPVDGLDLTRILKADDSTRGIPVVLTTAHAMRGDRERFLSESGADEYVSKPIEDNQMLVALVKSMIERSQTQAA